ncbi:hypothetical protein RDWZM_006522 [Blomia tropicalis]|uniref:Glucosylceramidase n=1 Tax=Blomia tropicalis TaxID=40697 RepID=A0A9Q0M7W5_BLOTA|nr:hypothetical protein RDWZM_006522 [Blomia tropicalis]
MGGDTQVCVCSESDNCDGELEYLNHISKKHGRVTSFVTSKAGSRFAKHLHRFKRTKPVRHYNLEINIDHNTKYHKIIGFGGAFSDSTGNQISRLSHELQERLIKDYFGPDGIEYRLGRVTIGGSDFSTRMYSLDDHPNDESLSTFALQNEDYKYKIPFMRWAQKVSNHRDELKFIGTAWSSPAWMKTNRQLNHGGFLRGRPGGKYYKAYAKYLVKFLQEYKKNDVPIWGLTVVNEPGFGKDTHFPYNCLGFTAKTQRDYIKLDLGPELHNNGFGDVAILHYDHNIDHVEDYVNTILTDPEAAKYVTGTAYHWYERHNHRYDRSILGHISKRFPDKILLSTEGSLGYSRPSSLGDWHNFNEYADDIVKVLNEGVQGWIDWNMVLDINGGPSWVGTKLDAPIHISDDASEYYKLPLYYAMGHFSKFIVPKSVKTHIEVKRDGNGNKVEIVAFERPDNSMVLTVLNKNNHKIRMKIHDPHRGYLVVHMAANSMDSLIWY